MYTDGYLCPEGKPGADGRWEHIMSENVLESRLLRCAMAVVLAVGLALPTMGALAWGEPEPAGPEALEVSDKPLEGADEPAQGPAAEEAPAAEQAPDGLGDSSMGGGLL